MNPPISACIVCFNEEANIRDCLESLKWVDEIIVVDSFSTDKTVDICRAYTETPRGMRSNGCLNLSTVKVFQHQWLGYVKQKNYALNLASNDWVLALDADERISGELRQEIEKKWTKESYQDYSGYYMPRHTYYLGTWINHGGWYPDYKLRLFRKSCGKWEGIDPHDHVVVQEGKTNKLKSNILHYTYKNLSGQLRTIDKFSETVSKALEEKGKHFSLFNLITRPPIKFIETYVFKMGFLDGLPGFIIAVNSAFYVFTKHVKVWEKSRR